MFNAHPRQAAEADFLDALKYLGDTFGELETSEADGQPGAQEESEAIAEAFPKGAPDEVIVGEPEGYDGQAVRNPALGAGVRKGTGIDGAMS